VSTKLLVIQGLLNQVDALILTGGLAFAFVKAQGTSIGGSLVKDTMVDTAKELLQQARAKGKRIILPIDAVCSKTFPKGDVLLSDTQSFDLVVGGCVPDGFMGLDAGPSHVRCSDKDQPRPPRLSLMDLPVSLKSNHSMKAPKLLWTFWKTRPKQVASRSWVVETLSLPWKSSERPRPSRMCRLVWNHWLGRSCQESPPLRTVSNKNQTAIF
jgi:hypothetical protein